MAIERDDFPLPDLTDELSKPYFEAAARGELAVTRCERCPRYVWYPEPECPSCEGPLTWKTISGRGTLFTWAVVRRPFLPAFAELVPFVTALVTIAEDRTVRLPTMIVDADSETLQADQPVAVTFRPLSFPTVPDRSVVVPLFTPVRA